MPATSERQRRFMGMVYAYLKGELKDAPEDVKTAAKSITMKDAADFATKTGYHESVDKPGGPITYAVGERVETKVGGKWLPATITAPPHKDTGNYGVKFTVRGKTHRTVSSLDQLRKITNEASECAWELLTELHVMITEAEKKKKKKEKIGKSTAARVYHRDYERTKNKSYRQYDPADRSKSGD